MLGSLTVGSMLAISTDVREGRGLGLAEESYCREYIGSMGQVVYAPRKYFQKTTFVDEIRVNLTFMTLRYGRAMN